MGLFDSIFDSLGLGLEPSPPAPESYKLSSIGKIVSFATMVALLWILGFATAVSTSKSHPGLQIISFGGAAILSWFGARLVARLLLRSKWSWAINKPDE
jgi:hypothetical protein